MEAEHSVTTPTSPFWTMEAFVAGFTGYSYLRFRGNTMEQGPPLGILQYTFRVPTTAVYALHLRSNKNNTQDPTVSNDCYTRIYDDATTNTTTLPDFVKTYARGAPLLWNWNTNWELPDGTHPEPTYVLQLSLIHI